LHAPGLQTNIPALRALDTSPGTGVFARMASLLAWRPTLPFGGVQHQHARLEIRLVPKH
jgi:hypothetical protein